MSTINQSTINSKGPNTSGSRSRSISPPPQINNQQNEGTTVTNLSTENSRSDSPTTPTNIKPASTISRSISPPPKVNNQQNEETTVTNLSTENSRSNSPTTPTNVETASTIPRSRSISPQVNNQQNEETTVTNVSNENPSPEPHPAQNNISIAEERTISESNQNTPTIINPEQLSPEISSTGLRIRTVNNQTQRDEVPLQQENIPNQERTWCHSFDIIAALNSDVRMNQIEPEKKYLEGTKTLELPLYTPFIKYFDLTMNQEVVDNRTFKEFLWDETIIKLLPELGFGISSNYLIKSLNSINDDIDSELSLRTYLFIQVTYLFMYVELSNLLDSLTPIDKFINMAKVNNFDRNGEQSEEIISSSTKLFGKLVSGYLISEFLLRLTGMKESMSYIPFLLFAFKQCRADR